jgi:hypothetical protein
MQLKEISDIPRAKTREVAKPLFVEAIAQSSVVVGCSGDKETGLFEQFPA